MELFLEKPYKTAGSVSLKIQIDIDKCFRLSWNIGRKTFPIAFNSAFTVCQ